MRQVIAIGLCALACTSEVRSGILDDPEAIVVAVSVPDEAALPMTGPALKRPGESSLRFAAPGRDAVVLFAIPRSALIGHDGRPISAEMLAGMEASFAGTAMPDLGSCGRCLARGSVAPQTIYPGDRCPVPSFVPAHVVREGVERTESEEQLIVDRARAALLLSWPGACPCSPRAYPEPPPLRFRFVNRTGAGDPWPLGTLAQTSSGAVASFDVDHSFIVDAGGARVERSRVSPTAVCSRSPANALPFDGPIEAALGLADGRFLVASRPLGLGGVLAGSRFHIVDSGLGAAEVRPADNLALFPISMRPLSGRPATEVLISGLHSLGNEGRFASVDTCSFGRGILECASLAHRDALAGNDHVAGVVQLADGSAVAVGHTGGFLHLSRLPAAGEVTGPPVVTVDRQRFTVGEIPVANGPPVKWKAFSDPAHLLGGVDSLEGGSYYQTTGGFGQRAFACVERAGDMNTGVVIITATVSAADFAGPRLMERPEARWRVVYCTERAKSSSCGPFDLALGRSDRVVAHVGGSGRIQLDLATGKAIDQPASGCAALVSPAPETPEARFSEVFELARGWTLARDGGGGLWRRDDRSGGDFVRIHGEDGRNAAIPVAVFAVGPRTFWTIGGEGRRSVVTIRSAEDVTVVEDMLGGFTSPDIAVGAARDEVSGAVVIVGNNDGRPWVRRLISAGGLPFAEPIALPRGFNSAMVGVASVGNDRFAIITRDARALWLEDGVLAEVPNHGLDDPFTPAVEQAPFFTICTPRRNDETVHGPSVGRFRAITGTTGVAWASGCGGLIARISKNEVLRVVEDSLITPVPRPGRAAEAAALTAVRAFCPDDVLVGAQGLNDLTLDVGRTWRVLSRTVAPGICDAGELAGQLPRPGIDRVMCSSVEARQTPGAMVGVNSGWPTSYVGTPDRVTAIFGNNTIPMGTITRFKTAERFRTSVGLFEGAQGEGGHVVIAGGGGKIVVGYECD